MQLRIYFRQYQNVNLQGLPITYVGPDPQHITRQAGANPKPDWVDMTNFVGNLDQIQMNWTRDVDEDGLPQPGGLQAKRSTTDSLILERDAYDYVKEWLSDHVASKWNIVEVKIVDTSCGQYSRFAIKSNQVQVCYSEVCQFNVTLKQIDDVYVCLSNTPISDNWQGWFQKVPAAGKKHPRFSYCNEARPNGIMVIVWWLLAVLETLMLPILFGIALLVNSILAILHVIESVLNAIPGVNVDFNLPDYIDPFAIKDAFNDIYLEASGCGREHPAPLIRDYIINVCEKCGVTANASTIPIFFSRYMDFDSASGYEAGAFNPYYDACYLYTPYKRGIRRFKSVNLFSGGNLNDTDFYIEENAPIYSLLDFLDQISEPFNHRWEVMGSTLYFKRKDQFNNGGAPLFDFTKSPDINKIVEGPCTVWNEEKNAAFTQGFYAKDAADTCGNEVLGQCNGIVQFTLNDNNPNFSGEMVKTTNNFGGAKFRLDGAATDYIYDAMQVICNGQVFTASLIPIMKNLDSRLAEYANYVLLMKDETCTLPKIIIWDGISYMNAKAIRNVVPVNNSLVPTNGANPTPANNIEYPNYYDTNGNGIYTEWIDRHPAYTDVKGAALTSGSSEPGVYEVRDYFGGVIIHNAARLCNYPMYFEPHYAGTLWDRFHWIDDPRKRNRLNQNWSVKIVLCCEDIKTLGLVGNGTEVKLGYYVKIPTKWNNLAVITDITVSYEPDNKLGRYIELKGYV